MNKGIYTVAEGKNVTVYSRGKYLYIDYMLDGKRKQKSTKLEDTPQNRKVVNKEIIPQLQAAIALETFGVKNSKKETKTFEYYSEFFLKEKEKLRSYSNRLGLYTKVIEFFKNKNVKSITRLEIKQFLMEQNVKNETKGKYLNVIRSVLEFAVDDELLTVNPATDIKLPRDKDSSPEVKYFKRDEITILLDNAKEPMRTFLQIGLSTGLRPEEILALRFADIKDGYVKIERVKTRGKIYNETKTSASKRTVPLNVSVEHLKDNMSFYLFPNWNDVGGMKTQWKNLLKQCNLEDRGIYQIRHTFATHLLRDNIVSINELSGLLGHAKVSTTLKHYASVIDSKDENVAKKLSGFCCNFVTVKKSNENVKFS